MSTRRVLSVPVSDDLDRHIRLAARRERLTAAAWVRQRLLHAPRVPKRPTPITLTPFALIPRAWTVPEASALLNVSPHTIARKLRAGQLAGYLEQRSFYDPGRGRYLRRRWWMIPGPTLFAYMDERVAYEWEHGRRPYSRNGIGTSSAVARDQ